MQIQYIQYQQIDKQKWDACIDNAPNGLIYAYSYYLDALAKNWDALVLNDYEMVMPLTWNKKYGFYYLYQPFFCASLGVFGKNITAETVNSFLNNIPAKFCYRDFYLNYGNHFKTADHNLIERTNFVLSLNDSYDNIYSRFRENVKRNIRKCEQSGCTIKTKIDIDEVIQLSQLQSRKFSPVTPEDFENFKNLFHHLDAKGCAVTYGVYSFRNELLASCAFFFSHNRAYYILVGNHPDGKTIGASHALIHAFIQDHANKPLTLDFEGSDISSLAFFYSSFGASTEKYPALKENKMPLWAKWLKK